MSDANDCFKRPADFGGVAVFAKKGLEPEREALTKHLGWFVIADFRAAPGITWMHDTLLNGSLQFTCFPDRASAEAYWNYHCFSDNYMIIEISEKYVREALLARGHKLD